MPYLKPCRQSPRCRSFGIPPATNVRKVCGGWPEKWTFFCPISNTAKLPSSKSGWQAAAIRGQTDGLMRKFCPSDFENENPCRVSTSRITEISVSCITAPLYVSFALLYHENPSDATVAFLDHKKPNCEKQRGNC